MKVPVFLLFALLCRSSYQQDDDTDKVIQLRMLNGEDRPEGVPYLVGIVALDHHGETIRQCAGALISSEYVLTAQQCLVNSRRHGNSQLNIPVARALVYIGGYHFGDGELPVETRPKDWQLHAHYRHLPVLKNDLALIKLPVQLTESVKPVGLPCKIDLHELDGRTGRVAGWGLHNSADNAQSWEWSLGQNLQSVPVNIQLSRCQDEGRLCGVSNLKAGACAQENGSPLVLNNEVVGILSLPISQYSDDENCGLSIQDDKRVSEYTSVGELEYVRWISNVTGLCGHQQPDLNDI